MSSILDVDDIRYIILDLLDTRDLKRLAQTSKRFFDEATDRVWRSMTSLEPLLCCLPKDVRSRPLGPEDFARLDLYSSKIQRITLRSRYEPMRLPSFFRRSPENKRIERELLQAKKEAKKLRRQGMPQEQVQNSEDIVSKRDISWIDFWTKSADIRPTKYFMPNLTHIIVDNAVEELLMPLVGITGLHLQYVCFDRVTDRHRERPLHKFFSGLTSTPNLTHLHVRHGEPDLVPTWLIAESPLRRLRLDRRIFSYGRIDYEAADKPILAEILQKETMKHLTLTLTQKWYGPDVQALQQGYLPNLQSLWLDLRAFRADSYHTDCLNRDHVRSGWTSCRSAAMYLPFPPSNSRSPIECGMRPPMHFLRGLDSPELGLLSIKFPSYVTAIMIEEIIRAARSSCRLHNLHELCLDGTLTFDERGTSWSADIVPGHLTLHQFGDMLFTLFPLPKLKRLDITVCTELLNTLDLGFYQAMADGLPALECLCFGRVGHQERSWRIPEREDFPLGYLAAFCSMFPKLSDIWVGKVGASELDDHPNKAWICPAVKFLRMSTWCSWRESRRGEHESDKALRADVLFYFPNSGPDPRTLI